MTVNPQPHNSGEPMLAKAASWAVLVASFGLSASTWVALAVLAGFTSHLSIPVLGITLRLAWLMPIAVDGYVVVALVLWMSPVPAHVARFAKRNTYTAAGIGIAAQSAYHLLFTASTTDQVWRVVLAAIVGALPPAVAGLAVHMRALLHRENGKTDATAPAPTVTAPTLSAVPQPTTPAAQPPATEPAPNAVPVDVPERPAVPTPAELAARITQPRPLAPVSLATPGPVLPTTRTTRPAAAKTTPEPLPASATDSSITAPEPAQLPLPIVPPELLERATRVARQYRTEHGIPITTGQLAVRLQVPSGTASNLLAAVNSLDNPNTPTTTVNGARTATR